MAGSGYLFLGAEAAASLDMPTRAWKHAARGLGKNVYLSRALRSFRAHQDQFPIDCHSCRSFFSRANSHAVDTIQSGGVNSMSRQARHFGKGDGVCEHACRDANDEPLDDSWWHKLSVCGGTQHLRDEYDLASALELWSGMDDFLREHMLIPWLFETPVARLHMRYAELLSAEALQECLNAAALARPDGVLCEYITRASGVRKFCHTAFDCRAVQCTIVVGDAVIWTRQFQAYMSEREVHELQIIVALVWNLMLQAPLRITGCSMNMCLVNGVLLNPDGAWPRLRNMLLTMRDQLSLE
eukprot:5283474-Amphidinium_carterae.1